MSIDGFNEACKNIADSCMKVGDESMREIFFGQKKELTSLVLYFSKMDTLGTELNTVNVSVTEALQFT